MTAIAVTIAGSDSGGGAGIQADLKTFSALGVYGASVIAALTAQNTLGVQGIFDVPPAFVTAQIDSVFADLRVGAVKIGMLSRPETIAAVAAGLDRWQAQNVVLDPVMVATSGDRLITPDAIAALTRLLMPRALVATPNLHEAAALLDAAVARDEAEMRAQGEAILKLGPRAVLIKGAFRRAGGGRPADPAGARRPAGVAAARHAQYSRHRLHAVVCTRRRVGQGAGAGAGHRRGQGLRRQGHRGVGAAEGRRGPGADPSFPCVVVTGRDAAWRCRNSAGRVMGDADRAAHLGQVRKNGTTSTAPAAAIITFSVVERISDIVTSPVGRGGRAVFVGGSVIARSRHCAGYGDEIRR